MYRIQQMNNKFFENGKVNIVFLYKIEIPFFIRSKKLI